MYVFALIFFSSVVCCFLKICWIKLSQDSNNYRNILHYFDTFFTLLRLSHQTTTHKHMIHVHHCMRVRTPECVCEMWVLDESQWTVIFFFVYLLSALATFSKKFRNHIKSNLANVEDTLNFNEQWNVVHTTQQYQTN